MEDLFEAAARCLLAETPEEKVAMTRRVYAAWKEARLSLGPGDPRPIRPARPSRPRLVSPKELPKRGLASRRGRGAFYHALAHIELNAIDLAWDAVYRFRGMPRAYYDDWVGVALEEARHFRMLKERLEALGYAYGDFDAHGGLWQMAESTAYDVLARLALVPRLLEARGLDVTPGMVERLKALGDEEGAACLEVIYQEEKGHVAKGSLWFYHICRQRGLDPPKTFGRLVQRHFKGRTKGPLNQKARLEAGFTLEEIAFLEEP